ncbi:hypothetical protein Avbf_10403 [Armadillidium vulgare]|nr:hypothetical protein Avbf_10403 [Armadillidium vulgare]
MEGRVSQRIRQSQGQSFTRKAEAVQLTLSSTFDDMRCTLLRLLEKVKNLELKNSLDVNKIFEHYISQCGFKDVEIH